MLGQLRSALGRTEVSVHLVEVSPRLSQVQAGLLTGEQSRPAASEDQAVYRHGATPAGVPVSWYRHLDDVPRGGRSRVRGSATTGFTGAVGLKHRTLTNANAR